MKDFINIHDYIISSELVGDWDGQEEEVTDRINSMIHQAYNMFPDDISTDVAEQLFDELWAAVAGQEFVIEAEYDELESWLDTFVRQKLDEIEYD